MNIDLLSVAQTLGQLIDFTGVLIITGGVIYCLLSFLPKIFSNTDQQKNYRELRNNLARAILLGLELLVAGDIIRSVTGTPTLDQVLVLGLLVLIRSFLGITFEMEIEGRWPWSRNKTPQS